MKRILIDGRQADLSEAPIAINWEYLNLSEPGKKYSPYTSSLTLPFTPKNKSIMGFADVVGGDPTNVRDIQDVDLWVGPLRFIKGGTLKVLSSTKDGYQGTITGRNQYIEAIEGYTLDEIIADCAATFTYATYAAAIAALQTGTTTAVNKGFTLPRTLEGAITSSIWTIYSGSNGHTHEVWLSAAAILTQMVTEGVITLKVWEGGTTVDISSSALWTDLQKLYMPCWNWVLYDGGAAWTLEVATGQRLVNGQVIDRSQMVTFGGRTSWEFIKAVAQLFCAAIYQDGTEITLIPLNNIAITGAVDLTGKVRAEKKYFAIPGHASSNHITYRNTDNLAKDFARMTITSPVKLAEEKDLLTLDLMLPGQLWVNQYSKNFFNTDFNGNGSLANTPMLLYDSSKTATTTITHGTDTDVNRPLKILTYFNFAPWWAVYQLNATNGIVYDAEVALDHYSMSKMRPWLLVRANELGGLFYLNKITGFDPDSGKRAKCQIVKWEGPEHSISPSSFLFSYMLQTGTITIISNIAWLATFIGGGLSLDKTSGTGNDTVTVTATISLEIDTVLRFTFGGTVEEISVLMPDMELIEVPAIGTQTYGDPISPQPTVSITSVAGGVRRVFWGIYKSGALVSSGYKDFTLTPGTHWYNFTGINAPADTGTTFTFRVGYSSIQQLVSSPKFTITL